MPKPFSLFIVLIISFSSMISSSQVSVAADFGGMLNANTVWTASQNPYNLTSTVQVPKGITLRIEAGVLITGKGLEDAFLVAGKLEIVGSKENPVRIQNVQAGNVFRSIGDEPTISITHTLISDVGILWQNKASMNKAIFTLTNSEVIGSKGPIYVYYPKTFAVAGNYFYDTGGLSIGLQKCNGGPQLADDIQITNNTFDGKAGYTYNGDGWIVGWVSYCDGVINVSNNYFKNPVGTIISVPKGYKAPININAIGNFWEGMSQAQIGSFVVDSTDSLDYCCTVSISGALTSIPAGAPVRSIILQEKQEALSAKAASLKKTTITCVKGKLTKKVTAVKPKCPKGYKKK